MSIRKGNKVVATAFGVVKDQNNKEPISFWTGTLAEYNELKVYDDNTLYNITDDDVNEIALNSIDLDNKITNCLLEVPQRIKLELNDGTLTLKAGSQVIVPNGFEEDGTTPKFDYVTVESDITETSTLDTTCMVSLCIDDNTLIFRSVANYQSGTQDPSSQVDNSNYYYTDTNLVNDKTSSGTDRGSSLPIAIVNVSSTQIISINQVFNGMGYIGSTIWVDKGVKGLIPNGRNEDGTLKNIEYTTDKLYTATQVNNITMPHTLSFTLDHIGDDGNYYPIVWDSEYYAQDIQPASFGLWHDTYNNKMYASRSKIFEEKAFILGEFTFTEGTVTSFTPKHPFRAVDWNDINSSNNSNNSNNTTSGGEIGKPQISLDSNLPSDCVWLEGATVSRTTYANLFAIYGTTYGAGDGSTTFALPDFRNRAIWGSDGFGYLSAGLPNITGSVDAGNGSAGQANGCGNLRSGSGSGVFAVSNDGFWNNNAQVYNSGYSKTLTFNASRNNSIYGNSSTVQPPAIKVRVYTRYQ